MANDISAIFDTRWAAELAVEHLVQEHGIARTDVTVEAEGAATSSGTERSGGDAAPAATGSDSQPKLEGAIKVSVRSNEAGRKVVESALREAGGQGEV